MSTPDRGAKLLCYVAEGRRVGKNFNDLPAVCRLGGLRRLVKLPRIKLSGPNIYRYAVDGWD